VQASMHVLGLLAHVTLIILTDPNQLLMPACTLPGTQQVRLMDARSHIQAQHDAGVCGRRTYTVHVHTSIRTVER
jgi:hypothetical protein